MKPKSFAAFAAILLLAVSGAHAAEPTEDQLERMERFVDGLNRNNFRTFHSLISERELTRRISGAAMIQASVLDALDSQFDETIQGFFVSAFPNTGGEQILGTLVDMQIDGDEGSALVRYGLPGYRYVYHRYLLDVSDSGRIQIVDWIDYFSAYRFSEMAATNLLASMPSDQAIRSLFSGVTLDNNRMFLAREVVKAYRDSQAQRFFEIVDDMGDDMKQHDLVLDFRIGMAFAGKDPRRYQEAIEERLNRSPNDALYSMTYVDWFMSTQQYDRALIALEVFLNEMATDDAATLSRMSALALVTGEDDNAAEYAERATSAEPELKLGWWSLLRARAIADDFDGCIEVMQTLEDRFGERFDAAKLRRDKAKAFHKLAASEQFKDWRASR